MLVQALTTPRITFLGPAVARVFAGANAPSPEAQGWSAMAAS